MHNERKILKILPYSLVNSTTKRLLVAFLVVASVVAAFMVQAPVHASDPAILKDFCSKGNGTNRTSPFKKTPGMCLGQDQIADSVFYYQFAVKLNHKISDVSIKVTNGSGVNITMEKENDYLYVSTYMHDGHSGYQATVARNTDGKCQGSETNKITILAKGNGKSQEKKLDLCEHYSDSDKTLILFTADKLDKADDKAGNGDDGKCEHCGLEPKPDPKGCIQGTLGLYRDLPTLTGDTEERMHLLQERYVSYLKVDGPSSFEKDDGVLGVDASWFELQDGNLRIGNLDPGTYSVKLHYHEISALTDESPGIDWGDLQDKAVFTANNIKVMAGSSCALFDKEDVWLSSTTGDKVDIGALMAEESEGATTCAIDGIGWIICPVMSFMGDIADGAFNFLSNNFLATDSSVVRADDSNAVYTAWQAMRNLANALFVIAFIIIIYSQMTGAGISNYGVKRMLPRLVVAAVLVNVSFFICQLAVDLSNVLGYSIRNFFDGLASNATGGISLDLSSDATGSGAAGFFGGLVAIILAAGAVYLFAAALMPVLLGAVVALLMILFILLAREALIILLIVIAPVAFVAYLLPNTQKLFDRWRKIFVALLLVFPIIGLVFGASTLAAAVITAGANPLELDPDNPSDTGNFWGQIIGAGVAVLPLFIVPGILKKSLDSVGSVGAKINSIGGRLGGAASKKGASAYGNSRLAQFKNYRGQQGARRRNLIQSGAYSGRGGRANPMNWASRANKGINESGISGKFGDRSVATGNALIEKEDNELIDNAVALYDNDPTTMLSEARSNYVSAIGNNDTIAARAALKVLGGMGPKGQEEISTLIAGNSDALHAKPEILNATRSAVKGSSDPALSRFNFDSSGRTLEQIQNDKGTYGNLNAAKVANMTPESIERAMKVGGIDQKIVSDLLEGRTNNDLSSAQREKLMGGTPAATLPVQDNVPGANLNVDSGGEQSFSLRPSDGGGGGSSTTPGAEVTFKPSDPGQPPTA